MKTREKYLDQLNKFLEEVKCYKNKVNMCGLFLPYTLSRYNSAKKKCFYFGQDTYGWIDFNKMIEYYENNNIIGYIEENNNLMTVDKIIEYSNNKEGNFWTLIIRLHVFLCTNEIINVNEFSENDKQYLEEIGYGNLNSIELPKSLQNQGLWDTLNETIYWDVKEKSRVFDSLKYVLDLYDPDYIFIFNWDASKEKDTFYRLVPHCNTESYIDGIISTYSIENYKTKLIWCPHPNNLRFKSMNINELINIICKNV